jgi:hypothetical protein
MLINKFTPHLPKDNEEVNAHVKHLQAMQDAATVVDPALDRDDEAWCHKFDHQQSPHGDSASSLTPPEERGRRRDWDDRDLHDVIHSKDARSWIKNQRQESEHLEQERREERHYDYYGPYYDQPHRQHSPKGGRNGREVKAFSHDFKRVCWPLNFKPSGIDKFDGSTNPVEWLEVYQLAIKAIGGDSYVMANYLAVCLLSSAKT